MTFGRKIKPELLDGASPDDARRNLADIVRLNRYFGGHSVLKKLLAKAVGPQRTFTLVDVGAASGDTAQVIRDAYPAATVFSLDHSARNLEAASRPKLVADAFRLPFRERSIDYVFCSLFLHHFSDTAVVELLRHFHAVAAKGVLLTDLERNPIPYFFLPWTRILYRWHPITVHDGAVSVRAAFTAQELLALARCAGLINAKVEVHRPAFRLSMVALREEAGGHSEDDTHR